PASLLDVAGTAWLRGVAGGTSGLFVNSSGNVGVGTTAPSQLLQIYKSQNAGTGFIVQNDNSGTAANSVFAIGNSPAAYPWNAMFFEHYGTGYTANGLRQPSSTAIIGGAGASNGLSIGVDNATGPLSFYTNGIVNGADMVLSTGGNMGIGTTAPAQKLDIVGNLQFSGALLPNGSSGTTGQFLISGGTGSPTWTSSVTANALKWNSLTSPDGNLALAMSAYTSTFTYGAATGANVNLFNLTDTASNTGTGYLLNLSTGNSSALNPFRVVAANGVEALMVKSNGNVGIGTTNPGAKLDVSGSINIGGGGALYFNNLSMGGTINLPNNNAIVWRNAANNADVGTIKVDTSNRLNLGDSSNAVLINPNGGNVGIGTTGPSSKLQVYSSNDVDGISLRSGSSNAYVSYSIGRTASEGYLGIVADTNNFLNGSVAGNLVLKSGTSKLLLGSGATLGMTIDTTGNVGIGTTAPTAALNVAHPTSGPVAVFDTNLNTQKVYVSRNSTITEALSFGVDDTSAYIESIQNENSAGYGNMIFRVDNDSTADGYFAFQNKSASEFMRINSSGNVGIGTTAPLSKLGILGSASVGATYGSIAAPTSGMIIEGNVGIGTTGPAHLLHISGSSATAPTIAAIRLDDTAGNANSRNWEIAPGYAAYGNLDFMVSSAADGNPDGLTKMSIDKQGNVGIGTTGPLALLHLNTSSAGAARLRITETGDTADGHYAGIDLYDGATAKWAIVKNGVANDLLFVSATNNVMTMQQSGNVGIGTTAPTQPLDIVGNLQFSGALLPNGSSGTTGQFLISQGTSAPIWTSSVTASALPFSGITSGTNTQASMVVGTGAALTYSGTGTINASSLVGATWVAPGTIGSTTPSTAAFTTLTSSGATTLGTGSSLTNTFGAGASSINTIGSSTTPGALTLHGATTLDNTFTVSGSNLTSLGGNLTVTGTTWTATPTISGLITATSGLTSNGTLTVSANNNFTQAGSGTFGTGTGAVSINGETTIASGKNLTLTSGNITLSAGLITQTGAGNNKFAGNVGIGTTSPASLLDVAGTAWLRGVAGGTSGLFVNSSGNVGVGTTDPSAKLEVAGTLTVSGSNLTSLGGNLTVTGTTWTATPTISGLITATSGLTANGTLDANAVVTLGDNGDNV
ncbi:hypothetical protein HYU90_03220, partial [Candidatus Collierbacteria bacterium]|nr:hypothetical protein [Candidatus Collierbacteria bacterium]